jgi:hypothetical protein
MSQRKGKKRKTQNRQQTTASKTASPRRLLFALLRLLHLLHPLLRTPVYWFETGRAVRRLGTGLRKKRAENGLAESGERRRRAI